MMKTSIQMRRILFFFLTQLIVTCLWAKEEAIK